MASKQLTQAELTEQLIKAMNNNAAATYELAEKIDNLTHGEIYGGTLVDAINFLAESTDNLNKK